MKTKLTMLICDVWILSISVAYCVAMLKPVCLSKCGEIGRFLLFLIYVTGPVGMLLALLGLYFGLFGFIKDLMALRKQ